MYKQETDTATQKHVDYRYLLEIQSCPSCMIGVQYAGNLVSDSISPDEQHKSLSYHDSSVGYQAV